MMKMLARCTALLSLLIFSLLPAFANQKGVNACVSDLDNKIGTLYLCGYGGKFKVLSLEDCELQDSDMPTVVEYLKNHPRINALDLSQNNLTGKSMQMLSVIQTLAWMSASYNQVGDKGAIAIANMKSLTNLDLIASNVGDVGTKALAGLSLQALDLSRNIIHDDGAIALANNKSLIILSLDSNKISDTGAIALASHPSLQYLYMGWNSAADETAIAIAKNTRLHEIGLEYNNVHDAGALAIADSTTLHWVYLHGNHIGPKGIAALDQNKYFTEASTENNDGITRKHVRQRYFTRASMNLKKDMC